MTLHAARAEPGFETIRWGHGAYGFELRSRDERILARASRVLRPWTAPATASLVRRWTILPGNTLDSWVLQSDDAPDAVFSGDPARAVTVVENRALQLLLEGTSDVLTLHSALVARGEQGLLVLGPNEAGKSTLACALWRHGYSLLGDDVTIVDPLSRIARSAPRRVSLRLSSRELLGESLWSQMLAAPSTEATNEGYVFHPHEIDDRPHPSSVPLAACVFLARRGVQAARGEPLELSPAAAALALLPYSNLIRQLNAGAVIERMAPIGASVPAYDLGRAALSQMIAAVERILDGRA